MIVYSMTTDVTDLAAVRVERVRTIATARRGLRGPLIPILHAVQEDLGHIDQADVPVIADVLNLSAAEVHGVVTFYRDFRRAPGGRATVRICQAEACQAVGAEALGEHARRRLGVGFGETTSDGAVTLDEVFCLGNCALGPAVQVDGRLHGRVSPARLDALLGEVAP
jgi:formate dehydrogenase subunit gamma